MARRRWSDEFLSYKVRGCSNCRSWWPPRASRPDGTRINSLAVLWTYPADAILTCRRCSHSWPVFAPGQESAAAVPPQADGRLKDADTHVFISYAHSDRAYVDRLAQHLDVARLPVWYDRTLGSGSRFATDISHAIDVCFAVIVVLTPEAVESEWVGKELARAVKKHKPIKPLLLKNCDVPIQVDDLQAEEVHGGRMPTESFVEDLQRRHFLARSG